MKKTDFLLEILNAIQIMSSALGQIVEQHANAINNTVNILNAEMELKVTYMAYGGLVALHDLMEVLHESLKANEEETNYDTD